MAGNSFPVQLHPTFFQKVRNFPVDVYNFNDTDNITTLMKILLGNSGTGQLRNLQLAAKITQQTIEFSNLDNIMGQILNVRRISPEIYSFATNPFIDQLTTTQWQEIITKDGSYRERLFGAAEAFQNGCNLWGILILCEALTQIKFYAVESWRTPGYGRSSINQNEEVVLIPLTDNSFFTWDQSKKTTILQVIQKLMPTSFKISFGSPIKNFTQTSGSYVSASGYSEFFYLQPNVSTTTINTPANIQPGASTRYWVKNNVSNLAPNFAHLVTQEISIDLTGSVISVNGTDPTGNPSNSVATPSMSVTSTIYGAQ
jgi:hypothetical protein